MSSIITADIYPITCIIRSSLFSKDRWPRRLRDRPSVSKNHGFHCVKFKSIQCQPEYLSNFICVLLSAHHWAQLILPKHLTLLITKFFDSTCFIMVLGYALGWLRSYLCGRKECVIYNNLSSYTKDIDCGVPQGSILGPLLFLIYKLFK